MALVQEYKIGNTRIKIYDDAYQNKTQADIDQILERIAYIASTGLNGARQRVLEGIKKLEEV